MAKAPLYSATGMLPPQKLIMYEELEKWHKAARDLERISGIEKELRVNFFNKYFAPATGIEEGTNHIALEYGKLLTADYRINRKIDEEQLDAAIALGRIDRATVDELFRYKPSLRVGVWKEADAEIRLKLADIVTEEPGTPGLKLTTPKR